MCLEEELANIKKTNIDLGGENEKLIKELSETQKILESMKVEEEGKGDKK